MKNISKIALCVLLIASTTFVVSCSKDDNQPIVPVIPAAPSLYARLGGTMKVSDPNNPGQMIEKGRLSYRSVVDTTITLIVNDIVANNPGNFSAHFAPLVSEVGAGNTTNVAVLSKNLTDFFSTNTGGSSSTTYSGDSMADAHNQATNPRMGAKATNTDYDRVIGFVGTAAGKNGVTDTKIINDVVAVWELSLIHI